MDPANVHLREAGDLSRRAGFSQPAIWMVVGASSWRARVRLGSGQAVTVGVRPEHLVACGEGEEAQVRGPVEMVEQLGADALVHIGHGEATVIAANIPTAA